LPLCSLIVPAPPRTPLFPYTTLFRSHVLRTQRTELGRPALLAATLVIVQVGLGASVIWTRRAVVPTTAHLAVGAALLATCVALKIGRAHVRTPVTFRPRTPSSP